MASQQQQQQQQQQQTMEVDPISKFKLLVPHLKESLVNLMRIAGQNLVHNAAIDNQLKSGDNPSQRVDKNLEEFYSTLDQIELNLRLAQECLTQHQESVRHAPLPVPIMSKPETSGDGQTMPYGQFLGLARSQVTCAKEIHDALVRCADDLGGKR
ncbi:mediator of RNA polymerase II transcription subunit 29-like [Branchiostoma lanceolatum]|uniref:Mediator of RNA polymerase II transcription subunit 29 n=1 Tax=Branchiostoma lanceolatum TaxID=7740 RepID=A0A8J9ZV23_BRALA|nr:MED29 [Branchiostoma lanceolatum]